VLWTLKRLAISAFLLVHMAAVLLWNLPACAIRERFALWTNYYMLPLGLWQSWAMFAPEPGHVSATLEALAVDRTGEIRRFEFPNVTGKSPWEGVWGYRYSKYNHTLGRDESAAQREFAARYVIRRLGISADLFPVDVQLIYQLRPCPDPGKAPADLHLEPPTPTVINCYRFPNLAEAMP
jgi:hypothetical protein